MYRAANDVTGLGYNDVPPPFNDNYSFVNADENISFITSTNSETVSVSDKIPETAKSEENESVKSVEFISVHQTADKVQNVLEKDLKVGENLVLSSKPVFTSASPPTILKKGSICWRKGLKIKIKGC